MAMLLGKKIGMTQVYDESGKLHPVTVVQAGPCTIMQVKTAEKDGYTAIQLGYDEVKPSRRKKPAEGHAKKAKTNPMKFVREMRLTGEGESEYNVGDSLTVSVFAESYEQG
jgi:large subunit ribosomal protein L3